MNIRIPSSQLIEWVLEREDPLPWITYNEQIGRLELFMDNYMLSSYRVCPAYFFLRDVEGWHPRSALPGTENTAERKWFLDFGILWHAMMEEFYATFRSPAFSLEAFAIHTADEYWHKLEMDQHLGHPECQAIGGYLGFAGMLVAYAVQFSAENEKLIPIASEIGFGRKKEVPLYVDDPLAVNEPAGLWSSADIYLSGRLDLIFDDGYHILPMDHKTMGSFRGDPMAKFLCDDGPTGYIYALNKILPSLPGIGDEVATKRECNMISMNLIRKGEAPKADPRQSRFKRMPIYKSSEALEAYKLRMIATCNHLINDLEMYVRGYSVPRNTNSCTNWYHTTCQYFDIHRQQSTDAERKTLATGYVKLPIWDTEKVGSIENQPILAKAKAVGLKE